MNHIHPISHIKSTLEFNLVLEYVSGDAVSVPGRDCIQTLPFLTEPKDVKQALYLVEEMLALIRFDDPFPLVPFSDLSSSLTHAQVEGAFLQPEAFVSIHEFLNIVRRIAGYFEDKAEKYPGLCKQTRSLTPLPDLEKAIHRIVDPKGAIKDRASETLSRIRRNIERKSGQIRQKLQKLLQQMEKKGYTQENVLSLRDGRLVLPLKETHRRAVPGMVVDQSASGATVFVEPYEAVELGNEIRQLKTEETREIERLLTLLTDQVRAFAPEIAENQSILAQVDSWFARAKYGDALGGCAADIDASGDIVLKQAYHPLLLAKHDKKEVVPLSLTMADDLKCIIITGPNAGGKTVALKTLGLLALMHQHGMLVPVKPGSALPCFSGIFADIGDQQSIEQDLSTFSSHVQNLRDIVRHADERSLVLLDEIGASTDPAEGASLAMALLDKLVSAGARTLASTHMSELKVFAHEHPAIENGSMIFDQKTLRPTYQFQPGIPGASYAFEIAERYGLPSDIVNNARSRVGSERGQLESLINAIETEYQQLHQLRTDADRKESELSGLIALYKEKIDQIRSESESRKKELLSEAETLLADAQRDIENSIREIRETQAGRAAIRQAKSKLKKHQTRREKIAIKPSVPATPIQQKDWVRWSGHGGSGQVISAPDSEGRVLVQWNDMRLKIAKDQLEKITPPKKETASGPGFTPSRTVSTELDLRGLMVDEALMQVDQYLGDAHSAGYSRISIIHGKGTGALRKAVGKHLQGHPLIKSQRLGNWNEGDTGVTIAELK